MARCLRCKAGNEWIEGEVKQSNVPVVETLARAAGWVGVSDPLRYLEKYIARTEYLAGRHKQQCGDK